MSARPLPTLTTDVEAAKQDMDEYGYAILADALPMDVIDAMVERMYDQAAGEARLGALPEISDEAASARSFKGVQIGKTEGAFDVHGETAQARVFSLLNKGEIWRAMINPADKVHQVLEYIFTASFDAEAAAIGLEQKYLLSSTQAKFKHRDTFYKNRGFHTDQKWAAGHQPYPLVATCFYLLSDFNIENGCTWVVPGSHKHAPLPMMAYYTTPEGKDMMDRAVPVVAPKGSAFLFDGRICHAEGVNTSGEVRIHLNNYHCAPYMRQRELFSMNLRQDVIDALTPEQLKLLGFEFELSLQSHRADFGPPQRGRHSSAYERDPARLGAQPGWPLRVSVAALTLQTPLASTMMPTVLPRDIGSHPAAMADWMARTMSALGICPGFKGGAPNLGGGSGGNSTTASRLPSL